MNDKDNITDLIQDVPVEEVEVAPVEEGTTNMSELITDMEIDDDVDGDLAKEIKNRRIQMIKFGDEFEKWNDKHKINYLKKLASSMNEAADLMQRERNQMAVKLQVAKDQLKNVEKNLEIQKAIVFKSITDTNQAKEEYINRIQMLDSRVKTQDKVIEVLNTKLENAKKS